MQNTYYPWDKEIINLSTILHTQLEDKTPKYCLIGGAAVNYLILNQIINNNKYQTITNLIKNKGATQSLKSLLRSSKDLDCIYKGNNISLIESLGKYAKFFDLNKKELKIKDKSSHISFYTKEDYENTSFENFYESVVDNSKLISIPYNNYKNIIIRVATPEDIVISKLISFREKDIKDILLLKNYFKMDIEHIKELLKNKLRKEELYIRRIKDLFPYQ